MINKEHLLNMQGGVVLCIGHTPAMHKLFDLNSLVKRNDFQLMLKGNYFKKVYLVTMEDVKLIYEETQDKKKKDPFEYDNLIEYTRGY